MRVQKGAIPFIISIFRSLEEIELRWLVVLHPFLPLKTFSQAFPEKFLLLFQNLALFFPVSTIEI
jgi:hypothetical protein